VVTTALYFVDRHFYAKEPASALERDRAEFVALSLHGARNLGLLAVIVGAVLLPNGYREVAMGMTAAASYYFTPSDLHEKNGFSFGPIRELAVIFAGLFACLAPIEVNLAHSASSLPLQHAWQLFWGSGLLSSVLDNAPTYTAFSALARGLGGSHALVAGIDPIKLAAVSAGSVVMGATTYIGNGPNLMIKAVAEREGVVMPSFLRYAGFAFSMMLVPHAVTTLAFWLLER